MAPPDLDARMTGRDQRQRDADILAAAEMILGIEQAEGEAEQRGLRRKRDVALVPGEPDADDLLAVMHPARDDADIAHRGGVGAGERTGERKAGNLLAARKFRQEMLFLRIGTVFLDQLAGAERVRHHDDGDAVGAARRDFAENERLRLGGEAEPAMLLGDEHAEEAVVADELPDVVRHIVQFMANAPVVEPLAELGGRPVEKGALLGGQRDGGDAAKLRPVRLAGEQLGVPADGARLERLAFGLGDRRHRAFQRAIGGERDVFALDLGHARGEQKPRDKPAKQRPKREMRPMQMAMHEAHLRAQGEQGGGDRPGP